MTKPKMPEPMAYMDPENPVSETAFRWRQVGDFTKPLYTTNQVREILDMAVQECLNLRHAWKWDDDDNSPSGPRDCAAAIEQLKEQVK